MGQPVRDATARPFPTRPHSWRRSIAARCRTDGTRTCRSSPPTRSRSPRGRPPRGRSSGRPRAGPAPDRRLRRPCHLDQYRHRRRRRTWRRGPTAGATSASACASTGWGGSSTAVPTRLPGLRRHLPHLLGLHARRRPPLGADEAAGDLGIHPRLDRSRRGRPDAPADRAAGRVAGDPAAQRRAASRRERDRAGLAVRPAQPRGADRVRAVPPEPADPRPARRSRATRSRRAPTSCAMRRAGIRS